MRAKAKAQVRVVITCDIELIGVGKLAWTSVVAASAILALTLLKRSSTPQER